MNCQPFKGRGHGLVTTLGGWVATALLLSLAATAAADVSLPGEQHLGDDEPGGAFVPLDPVLFDRMTAYPTHFHLTQQVTVTAVSFQGLQRENANGRPYVTIDGTAYSATWDDGTDTLTLDAPPTLNAGLHTLALTGDCLKNNGSIGNCSGASRTENDMAFTGLTLVTQSGATTASRHWVRRRHLGSTADADDDYDDLGTAGDQPYLYPDAAEGGSVTLSFSLGADTYFDALWMFRLRAVDGAGGDLTLRRSGTTVWTDTITQNSPDNQDTPAAFPIDQTLQAGSYTLEIAASEDFSWDSVILKAPGPAAGAVGLGDFNAVEPGADATTGPLYTKVAGAAFDVDLVSLNNAGNLQNFNGDVDLELVDATSASDCANLTAVASLGTATFNNESRITGTGLTYADAIGAARLRITEATGGNPEQGCSQDAFSVRPHHLSVEARDADWQTAGTARRLDGTNSATCQAGGGTQPCHKAGRAFTLQGAALNAGGTVVTGYAQSAALTWALMSPPHDGDDTLGTRSPAQVSFAGDGSGYRTDTASYQEVGVLELTLTDQGNFAATSGDKGDGHCISGSSSNTENGSGQYGCQAATTGPTTAGRFVPDRFEVTHSGFGFAPTCTTATNFTYFGQSFPWSGTPTVTITAVEQGGSTTTNYEDVFWKLADYTDAYEDDSNTDEGTNDGDDRALDPSGSSHAWPSTTDANGQIAVDYSGTFTYTRNGPEAPIAGVDQNVKLRFDVADADGVQYEAGASPPTYLISGINGAAPVRWGRLNLANAHGPQAHDLAVPFTAQFYDGSQFVPNTDDGCSGNATDITITASDVDTADDLDLGESCIWEDGTGDSGTYDCSGAPAGENYTEPPNAGDFNVWLKAPGAATTGDSNAGSIDLSVVTMPNWLVYDWDGDGTHDDLPAGRATFGRYTGNDRILYWREVYQ